MNSESMANFIFELRKSKNMTQKQLAEKLNITDKAVSKWERGLGYPDISILSSLADVLGVTTNELLNGKRSTAEPLEPNTIVETTLQYANKVTTHNKKSALFIGKISITIACLLSIFICVICDMAISGSLTWSLYPITALLFTWLIIMPLFQFPKNKIRMSLISLSVFIIPFLYVLNKIIGGTKFMLPIGIPVALIAIAYLWCIYILFSAKRLSKWNAGTISVILWIPISIIINYIIVKLVGGSVIDVWDILSYGILCVIASILFYLGMKKEV